MKLSRRNNEQRPHAAVGMDAEDLQILTTIAVPLSAGVAVLAIDVRLDRAAISHLYIGDFRTRRYHLHAKFMARIRG